MSLSVSRGRSILGSSFNDAKKPRRAQGTPGAVELAGMPLTIAEVDEELQATRKRHQDVEERRLKEWENHQRSNRSSMEQHHTSKAFLDFTVAEVPLGRMVLELFEESVPEAVENFRSLVTGSAGFDPETGYKLDYLDSIVHRVEKGVAIYLGEIQTLSISSAGHPIRDENFSNRHLHRGVVSMVSRGPNTIGSVFCITLDRAPNLDFKYVVIGKVVDGLGLLDKLEAVPTTRTGRPTSQIQISFCGALTGPKPTGVALEQAAARAEPEIVETSDSKLSVAEEDRRTSTISVESAME